MSATQLLVAVSAGAWLVSCLGTGGLIPLLRRGAVLDRPNERSLHATPVPRGGGIAVVGTVVVAWLLPLVPGVVLPGLLVTLCCALLLAVVSWRDDRSGLSPAKRFTAQCVAVGIVLALMVADGLPLLTGGMIPLWIDAVVTALLWLWFINLFNFMDGIDGIAGSEAAAIGIGLALFGSFGAGYAPGLAVLSAAIAGAAIGFLWWNWAPARIFLGDVGSVPLGFLLGFLLLVVASEGHWKIALILPLYFLADATITLLRRLLRRERVWQPHRTHFYQRAVQSGLGHATVVWRVNAANLLLVGFGWAAENGAGWFALAAAGVTVILLLGLIGLPRGDGDPIPAAKPRLEEPPA